MDIPNLPTVPFGKYKGQPVTKLLEDKSYADWLKKQDWFLKNNTSPIYNIVINQTITTNNSKTPEHNRLQNLFLDKNNQQKLLYYLFNKYAQSNINKINNILQDENIIRCFGKSNNIPEFDNKSDKISIMFEYKFNWDLFISYKPIQRFEITSIPEIEMFDKEQYKKEYYIQKNEKYNNNILLLNRFKEEFIKFDIEYDKIKNKECIRSRKDALEDNTIIKNLYQNINDTNELCNLYCWYCLNNFTSDKINEIIEKYKDKYEEEFNDHYIKYKLEYYSDIVKKYNVAFDYIRINKNQLEIRLDICSFYRNIYLELKPSLSDDYPCVLRKLQTQIELTKKDDDYERGSIFILLIESFTSKYTSKEQLITIFKQHNIRVIFTNKIFKMQEIESVNTDTKQVLCVNKLIEENKLITDNLTETQQKLLQAEEKIKQLEEEILSLKT